MMIGQSIVSTTTVIITILKIDIGVETDPEVHATALIMIVTKDDLTVMITTRNTRVIITLQIGIIIIIIITKRTRTEIEIDIAIAAMKDLIIKTRDYKIATTGHHSDQMMQGHHRGKKIMRS